LFLGEAEAYVYIWNAASFDLGLCNASTSLVNADTGGNVGLFAAGLTDLTPQACHSGKIKSTPIAMGITKQRKTTPERGCNRDVIVNHFLRVKSQAVALSPSRVKVSP
jgi:hypothetical protein